MDIGFEKNLFPITTIVKGQYSEKQWSASGFFYNVFEEPITKLGWSRLKKTYLITNRHVTFYTEKGSEHLAQSLTFYFRCVQQFHGIEWKPIKLTDIELRKRILLHKNKLVDVVLIDISDYFENVMHDDECNNFFSIPISLSNRNLPQNQKIKIQVADDIIVASYPNIFYDKVNKFPIVKSGIIASAYGLISMDFQCSK